MEKKEQQGKFIELMARFTAFSAKHLPDDVIGRLRELREKEQTDIARIMYDAMFENIRMAEELSRPVCQDTGLIQYFVKTGADFPLLGSMENCLREAVMRATEIAPLRPNAVEVFDGKNTGNNVGTGIPWIDWEIVPDSDDAEIYVYMSGGGSSLPGVAKVFMPSEGFDGILKLVFDRVATYGINACPPLYVGIGIAGSADMAAKLSKKALLRPIGSRSSDPSVAELEGRIEKGLNDIKIGPGGLNGESSVMGVSIEQAARHPATLAAALAFGCWAHRRALIRMDANLDYEVITHKGAVL